MIWPTTVGQSERGAKLLPSAAVFYMILTRDAYTSRLDPRSGPSTLHNVEKVEAAAATTGFYGASDEFHIDT